jgi:hypothetical protein
MPAAMRASPVCLLLMTLMATTSGLDAQSGLLLTTPPVRTMTAGGTTALSSSVMGSYYFTRGDAGMSRLEMLVLWRGQPSWYSTRATAAGAATFSGFGAPSMNGRVFSASSTYNGVQLIASTDTDSSRLIVQGQTFDIRRANVVLVDTVDAPSGPVIVDTFRIDAQLPNIASSDILIPVLNAASEIQAFLRCGVPAARGTTTPAGLCGKVSR